MTKAIIHSTDDGQQGRAIWKSPNAPGDMESYVKQRKAENSPAAATPTSHGEQEFPSWEEALDDAWSKAKTGEIKLIDFAKIVAEALKAEKRGEPWKAGETEGNQNVTYTVQNG